MLPSCITASHRSDYLRSDRNHGQPRRHRKPILLLAKTIGLLLATIWSAALRQNVNATVYKVFIGFYGSFAVLSLGWTHNWFFAGRPLVS